MRRTIYKIVLDIILIIGCIVLSAMQYDTGNFVRGILWSVTSMLWGVDLGISINNLIKNDYICFLEFMTYQYMQKIKMEKKEQNAKQEQTNSSKEFKGE